jgi:hypothetical protein
VEVRRAEIPGSNNLAGIVYSIGLGAGREQGGRVDILHATIAVNKRLRIEVGVRIIRVPGSDLTRVIDRIGEGNALLPKVLILVALPPLHIVAMAAVGVSETPAASPASLRTEAWETLLPGRVPRSVTVYCWASLGVAGVHSQSAGNIREIPFLLVNANSALSQGVRTTANLDMFL